MTETPELGDLIRESRLALGYSLGQLATKVGRTAATVRTWERGEAVPNEESRAALVKVLGIDPTELEGLVPTVDDDSEPDAGATPEGDGDAADSADEPVAVTLEPDDGSEPEEESAAAGASDESDSVTDGDESDLDAAAGVAVAAALVGAADADLILPANDEAESVQPEDDEDGEEPQGDDAEPGEGADDEDEPTEPAADEADESDESDAADDADTDVPLVVEATPLEDEASASEEGETQDAPDSDGAEGDDVEGGDVEGDGDAADDDADDTDDTLEGIAAVTPFEVDPALIDEPTEAVVLPVVATATGVATQTRSVVTVSEPKERTSRNPLRILFDPSKRWLYWIRALFTLVVAGALVVVLVWAAGEFFDALGQVLDSIEPTEVDDGGIDAMGRLRTLI